MANKTKKPISASQKKRVVVFLVFVLTLLVVGHFVRTPEEAPSAANSALTTIDILPVQPTNVPAPVQPVEVVIAESQPGEPVDAEALEPTESPELLAAQVAQATLQLAQTQHQPTTTAAPMAEPIHGLIPLLYTTYTEGGEQARQLANIAASQAHLTPELSQALTLLRNNTPRHGPITKAALLVHAKQALALTPIITTAPAEDSASTSWWRRQISKVVSLEKVDNAAAPDWHSALQSVELLIALGNTNDALVSLRQAPLAKDERLEDLRQQLATYSAQRSYLNQVVRAYTNQFDQE